LWPCNDARGGFRIVFSIDGSSSAKVFKPEQLRRLLNFHIAADVSDTTGGVVGLSSERLPFCTSGYPAPAFLELEPLKSLRQRDNSRHGFNINWRDL
jgi:hypothetical protein